MSQTLSSFYNKTTLGAHEYIKLNKKMAVTKARPDLENPRILTLQVSCDEGRAGLSLNMIKHKSQVWKDIQTNRDTSMLSILDALVKKSLIRPYKAGRVKEGPFSKRFPSLGFYYPEIHVSMVMPSTIEIKISGDWVVKQPFSSHEMAKRSFKLLTQSWENPGHNKDTTLEDWKYSMYLKIALAMDLVLSEIHAEAGDKRGASPVDVSGSVSCKKAKHRVIPNPKFGPSLECPIPTPTDSAALGALLTSVAAPIDPYTILTPGGADGFQQGIPSSPSDPVVVELLEGRDAALAFGSKLCNPDEVLNALADIPLSECELEL